MTNKQPAFDITVVGGSTKDIFLISDHFKVENDQLELVWGEKFVADDIFTAIGGGGANAAVAFSRLGLHTGLLSQVGSEAFGYEIKEKLQEEGVETRSLRVSPTAHTSTSALLCDPNYDHAIVMYRGANDDLKVEPDELKEILNSRWVYITDLAGESEDLAEVLAQEAKKYGTKVAFIPGQHQLGRGLPALERILKNVNCFILNSYEAARLLGEKSREVPEDEEIKVFLERFSDLGAKVAVITQDVKGVDAHDGVNFYHQKPPQVEVVDTTGAGDAFASGFVAALAKGSAIEKALELGTKNAGSVLGHFGAQTGLIREM